MDHHQRRSPRISVLNQIKVRAGLVAALLPFALPGVAGAGPLIRNIPYPPMPLPSANARVHRPPMTPESAFLDVKTDPYINILLNRIDGTSLLTTVPYTTDANGNVAAVVNIGHFAGRGGNALPCIFKVIEVSPDPTVDPDVQYYSRYGNVFRQVDPSAYVSPLEDLTLPPFFKANTVAPTPTLPPTLQLPLLNSTTDPYINTLLSRINGNTLPSTAPYVHDDQGNVVAMVNIGRFRADNSVSVYKVIDIISGDNPNHIGPEVRYYSKVDGMFRRVDPSAYTSPFDDLVVQDFPSGTTPGLVSLRGKLPLLNMPTDPYINGLLASIDGKNFGQQIAHIRDAKGHIAMVVNTGQFQDVDGNALATVYKVVDAVPGKNRHHIGPVAQYYSKFGGTFRRVAPSAFNSTLSDLTIPDLSKDAEPDSSQAGRSSVAVSGTAGSPGQGSLAVHMLPSRPPHTLSRRPPHTLSRRPPYILSGKPRSHIPD